MTRPVVLLAEDSADDQFLFKRTLDAMQTGAVLVTLTDGDAVSSYLKGDEPYADRVAYPLPMLVILDVKLPKVDGMEILQQIKGNGDWQQMRVALLSGVRDPKVVEQAMALGAVPVMEKPVTAEQLRSLLQSQSERKDWSGDL